VEQGESTTRSPYPQLSSSGRIDLIQYRVQFHELMTSYNTHYHKPDGYPCHGYGHWNDQVLSPPYPTDSVETLNPIYYAHPQINTGTGPFPTIVPSSSAPNVSPLPPPFAYNPQPPIIPQFITSAVIGPGSYNLSSISNISAYQPSTGPSASLSTSSITTVPTVALPATSVIAPASTTLSRTKFPCLLCGKLCTNCPRADACFNNHFGAKPFACNGACGSIGW
jgi:hypothetical protein